MRREMDRRESGRKFCSTIQVLVLAAVSMVPMKVLTRCMVVLSMFIEYLATSWCMRMREW